MTLTEDDIKKIINDVRRCDLVLYTTFNYNQQEFTREDYITIQQYNTITVNYTFTEDDEEYYTAYCGFSREDMGGDDFTMHWGYGRPNEQYRNGVIYLDVEVGKKDYIGYKGSPNNGSLNVNYIQFVEKYWDESAVNNAQHICYKIEGNGISKETEKRTNSSTVPKIGWYLPAEYELKAFMDLSEKCFELGKKDELVTDELATTSDFYRNSVTKLRRGRSYWSSTTAGNAWSDIPNDVPEKNNDPAFSAMAYEYSSTNTNAAIIRHIFYREDSGTGCRIRQAIQFDDAEAGN